MIEATNPPDDRHPIDELVREHVEREASTVDATAMLSRVREGQHAEPRRRHGWLVFAAGLSIGMGIGAAAAVLLLVHFGNPAQTTTQVSEVHAATPDDLVRGVFVAHSDGTDRLYDVKVELGNMFLISKKYPNAPSPAHLTLIKDSKLWIRGNQFWIDPGRGTNPMCWGRDRDGRVWVVGTTPRGHQVGLQYARDDADDRVTRLCNLMSLRVPTLTVEMLDEYELTRSDANGPDSLIRVVGRIRSSPRDIAVSQVTLELDPRTKVIRKAVQKRTIGNDLIGTFSYTLIETGRIPDVNYELRGHLEPGSKVFDAKDTAGRTDMFNRFPPPLAFKKL